MFKRIVCVKQQYMKTFNRMQTNDLEWIELIVSDRNKLNPLTVCKKKKKKSSSSFKNVIWKLFGNHIFNIYVKVKLTDWVLQPC